MAPCWQEFVCLGLRLTGVPWFMREIYARHKVTIVNYHDPAPNVFERHMAFFARVYSFISIDRLAQALEDKDFPDLPPKPMVVTIDDGHIGNARLFKTIRKYRVPAVIYAVAGVVNTNRGFWFDRLPHGGDAMRRLKGLPDVERRSVLQQDYGHTDEREYENPAALSAEQLREFIQIGGAVGSHTVFHPLLDRCSNETGMHEVKASRELLESMLGHPVVHFAHPEGAQDARTRRWLQESGYRTARTIEIGRVLPYTDPLHLPNFGVSDDAGMSKAVVQACGLWDWIKTCLANSTRRNGKSSFCVCVNVGDAATYDNGPPLGKPMERS